MDPVLLCLLGGALVLLVVFFASAIKVVPEFQRLVVFRLGRVIGEKGPGLTAHKQPTPVLPPPDHTG